jgi:WD40 repeat protein
MPCSTGPRQGCADVLPVFSPRGRRLATAANEIGFIEDEKGRLLFEDLLAVRDVSGRVRRTISQLEKGITAVAWSADARQLGFSTLRGIYTVRPDGTDQKLFSDERAGDLAWSRQGRLAWTPMNGGRISVTNRARIRVRRLRVFAYSVAWSPTGRRLAYITSEGTLKTVSANGRNRRTLTRRCDGPQSGFGFDSDVAWSPDGRQLLCSSLQRGLLAVNVRTGRVRTVVRGNFSAITSFDWQKAPRR